MKLNKKDYEYRRTENSVSSINYHFIFVPKRRKAILVNSVATRLHDIIFELVSEHGWRLIALEIMPDHIHMLINAPTHEAPSQIARWVNGRAARYLRKEFPQLKKLPCLWSPSYFIATTGQLSTDVVKRYIENQKSKIAYAGLKPHTPFHPLAEARGSQVPVILVAFNVCNVWRS